MCFKILYILTEPTTGILLQGNIRNWTRPIIEEYQQIFSDSEIVLSTWDNEDISNIPCKVIQSEIPEETHPYKSSKNYQIIGCRNGLRIMKSDIILKIRTDMFIHNPNIFKIFLLENTQEKIMYPYSGFMKEFRDYWITDLCQLSSKKTLLNYWNFMPLHDGSTNEPVETFLTKNYVVNILKDNHPWNMTHDKYFIRKRYHEDFQIEFERYVYNKWYQNALLTASLEDE
jgi:hypothetical protein